MFATATPIVPNPIAAFVCLDIETGDSPAEDVERALENWKPPGNVKDPEKIDARREEAAAKIRERAALLDTSPIFCVAIKTDRAQLILNGMDASAPAIDGWTVTACGDEDGLLRTLRVLLDQFTRQDTLMVGHNLRNFDLPKLRHGYIRHGLKLPAILKPRLRNETPVEVIDTASLFEAFSMEHRDDFCPSLDTVAVSLGIPRPKQHMNGADCPRLYREGQIATVLLYCAVDTATTTRAFQLMIATAPDRE